MGWPRSLQFSEQGLEIIKNNIARIKKNNPSWNNLDWLEKLLITLIIKHGLLLNQH